MWLKKELEMLSTSFWNRK